MNKPKVTANEPKWKRIMIDKSAEVHDDVEVDISAEVIVDELATVYHGVKIITHKHHWPTRTPRRKDNLVERVNLRIGKDAFIGENAMLITVRNIGEGAIIGAGSVVTKDVPPYEIWAGNPAVKIGERKGER